jgi:hypothetical protein
LVRPKPPRDALANHVLHPSSNLPRIAIAGVLDSDGTINV